MSARRSPARALMPIALGLSLICGCGGGGGSEPMTTSPLTRAELIRSGDEICVTAADRFARLQENPPTTSAGAAEQTRAQLAITDDELAGLRALKAPADVEPALERYLRARDRGVEILKRQLEAAKRNDPNDFAAERARLAAGQVERLRLAQAVGFSDCSRPGAASSGE